MTSREAATLAGVDRRTIQRWIARARRPLPVTRTPGGHARIGAADLRRWLARERGE